MVISKKQMDMVENMSDFVELVEINFKKIVDIDETSLIEILFVE